MDLPGLIPAHPSYNPGTQMQRQHYTSRCAGGSACISPAGHLRTEKGDQEYLGMIPGEVQGSVGVGLAVGEEPSHDCGTDQISGLP